MSAQHAGNHLHASPERAVELELDARRGDSHDAGSEGHFDILGSEISDALARFRIRQINRDDDVGRRQPPQELRGASEANLDLLRRFLDHLEPLGHTT